MICRAVYSVNQSRLSEVLWNRPHCSRAYRMHFEARKGSSRQSFRLNTVLREGSRDCSAIRFF